MVTSIVSYIYLRPIMVLIGLIFFHMLLSVVFSSIAHSSIAAHLHNGEGFWNFARDATLYHKEAIIETQLLNDGLWIEWLNSHKYHLNTKAISILYWVTNIKNPLIFELVNGPLWVISIVTIYKSSKLLFNDRVALYSVIFFFQPSILMSSMQLLRDPILIAGFSILCYGWLDFYKNKPNLKNLILIYIGFILIFSMRSYLISIFSTFFLLTLIWYLVIKNISFFQVLLISIPLFIFVQSFNHIYLGNLGIDKVITDRLMQEETNSLVKEETNSLVKEETNSLVKEETNSLVKEETNSLVKEETNSFFIEIADKLSSRINKLRYGFYNNNQEAGSKIDSEVTFDSLTETLIYLPNAMQNGFLSPFPRQWLKEGKETGRIGRAISGFETMMWYFLIFSFLYVLIRKPRTLMPFAPILVISIAVIILLGYVVPNVGAIYRMRQSFMIPFFIFGVYGAQIMMHSLFTRLKNK
jgi:hypothetical protein